jgi:pSer/pThr/pTyr-binding forkhead associated (FHA) protein
MELLLVCNATRREIAIKEFPAMIGRDPSAEINIKDDSWVGHFQCILDKEGDHVRVLDLGTRVGTFVNGRRVQRAVLMPGDTLTVGKTDFTVLYQCHANGQPAAVGGVAMPCR